MVGMSVTRKRVLMAEPIDAVFGTVFACVLLIALLAFAFSRGERAACYQVEHALMLKGSNASDMSLVHDECVEYYD